LIVAISDSERTDGPPVQGASRDVPIWSRISPFIWFGPIDRCHVVLGAWIEERHAARPEQRELPPQLQAGGDAQVPSQGGGGYRQRDDPSLPHPRRLSRCVAEGRRGRRHDYQARELSGSVRRPKPNKGQGPRYLQAGGRPARGSLRRLLFLLRDENPGPPRS